MHSRYKEVASIESYYVGIFPKRGKHVLVDATSVDSSLICVMDVKWELLKYVV